ncbi:MAG: tetratricopeptide repeat protein [Acidobacteriaceae bacterium]
MAASCGELQQSSAHLISLKKYSEVVGVLERSLAVCPNRKAVLLALAKAQMLSEQFSASLGSLKTLLAEDPANMDALLTQGKVFYLLNRDAEADATLRQAIKIAPAASDPHYMLGRLYYAQSNLKEATAQFQEAVKLDPKAYKAYDGLALCYETSGDISDASHEYMAGLELVYKDHPTYDVIYADFAEFLLKYGSDKKAFDLAAAAASRNSGEPRNFYLAGKALYEGGHLEECLPWLERAIKINPLYPDPHNILARAYKRLGKDDLANQEAKTFQELLAKAPTFRR